MKAQRPSRVVVAILLALAAGAAGCGGAFTIGQRGGGSVELPAAPARERAITLTDVDDVRDVAASDARIYVATDRGIVVYPASGGARASRIASAQGLPSDETYAVAVGPDGAVLVATSRGLATVQGDRVTPIETAPPVGRVTDLHVGQDGVVWACGADGVAKLTENGWVRFGERTACIGLVPTPDAKLWVRTTAGLWYVEGDVVREHAVSRGIPEGYVRDIVPAGPGRALALVQGPSRSLLGLFDGERWFAYTVGGIGELPAVGLVRRGDDVLLLVPGHAIALTIGSAVDGVSLTPLSASPPLGVRSYRARITPADAVVAPAAGAQGGGDEQELARAPKPLTEIPVALPEVDDAPELRARTIDVGVPSGLYFARSAGDTAFCADRNRGIVAIGRATRRVLRTNDLVDPRDLQLGEDPTGATWVLSRNGDVTRWADGALRRVHVADGVDPWALAGGGDGVYVLARVRAPATAGPGVVVRVYRTDGGQFAPMMERTLVTQTSLVGVPFIGAAPDHKIWAALRVAHEQGSGTRVRGVAVLDPTSDVVVYHHRSPNAQTDGPGALEIPEEVSTIEFTTDGFAWLSTLSGALRIGNSQAVIFGEARGVRGEVVTDVAIGDDGRIWIAAAEGVGSFQNGRFDFTLPRIVRDARPLALAVDTRGAVWGAGVHGMVHFDGRTWSRAPAESGFPQASLVDVEVDSGGRVWVLGEDRVTLVTTR